MTLPLALLAGGLFLAGAVTLFRTRRPRTRLAGLALLALGGLLLTAVVGPEPGAALATAGIGAVTLAGLLLVARAMERTASRDGGDDLRIDVDPLRWP